MRKRIAVFTSTRADYGLLYWLMKDIEEDEQLELKLLAAGTHLSPEFGSTYESIEADGFVIDEKVEMLLSSDSAQGVAKSIGLGVIGFTDALTRMAPDVLVLLGDRFEALAVAQTALILRIPIVHLHGGEITEGAYDDSIRHAITKLSYLHCTSTEEYRQRVIQLGESPDRVKNVGAIGLEHLVRTNLMTLDELASSLNFNFEMPFFLVTYHPVTVGEEPPKSSFEALLDSLDAYQEHQIIITYPNADDGGRQIIPLIERYATESPGRVCAIQSLGQKRYLSAVKYAAAVIGNSSSGIIEVPSFNVPTVNVGVRQQGRIAASSVIHCDANVESIREAISVALDSSCADPGDPVINPYRQENTTQKIIEFIKSIKPGAALTKQFHNFR
jgi:UDP-hydrolysing UDP-N-acetyl-D-glucosamine 2-epimerase